MKKTLIALLIFIALLVWWYILNKYWEHSDNMQYCRHNIIYDEDKKMYYLAVPDSNLNKPLWTEYNDSLKICSGWF